DSAMPEHRNRVGHPTANPQQRLIAPTEMPRLERRTRAQVLSQLQSMGGSERDRIQESANSRASNRSKADKDPTEWLPPYAGYWCTYVTDWVAEKTRQLTITPAERLAVCPDQPITVTLDRKGHA
ncbi:hypothetical protein ACWGKC_43725, partial [Streptomyces sp. NPDC054804]